MPEGSELSGVPVGDAGGGGVVVVVVVGGGGGLVVVVVGAGAEVTVAALGGGVVVVVEGATVVVVDGDDVVVVVVVDAGLWRLDDLDPDRDEVPREVLCAELVVEPGVRCPPCDETVRVGIIAETVAVDVIATVVPGEPWFLMAADASMLTIAAKTLDATISVTTLEIRRLPLPNMNCRRVPLLMKSKFAEQNHTTTNSTSTTTQFR
jgi:hypothetical protein